VVILGKYGIGLIVYVRQIPNSTFCGVCLHIVSRVLLGIGGGKTHSHLRQQPTNHPSIHPSYRMYCTYLRRYIQYIARRYLSPANLLPEITTQTLTLYVSHDIHLICFIPYHINIVSSHIDQSKPQSWSVGPTLCKLRKCKSSGLSLPNLT